MFDKNRSGQFLSFCAVSALSGNPVTGIASGNISGCRSIDGGALTVCSGPIIEDGGGLYHLNLYAPDVNGNNIGFLFTMSGCVPVAFTVITAANISGQFYLPSGQSVAVNSGNLSTNSLASGMLAVEIPYGILKADFSGVVGEAQRSVLNSLRKLINKWDTKALSGKLVVYKEDDIAQAFTQNLTTASGGLPVSSLDTN